MLKTILDIAVLGWARLVMGILAIIPRPIALICARGIVEILLRLMGRARAVGRRNLEIAFPELAPAEREFILRRSFWVLADNLLGFAEIPRLSKARASAAIDFSQALSTVRRLRSENPGVGVLVATMHYGPFELLVQLYQILCGDVSMLARGFDLPRLDRWWNNRRELFGASVYSRTGAYQEMVKRLNSGGTVVLLCDQNVKINHATFVDFFGIPAATTKSVALAAMRTGAPVLVVAGWHKPCGEYELLLEELPGLEAFPGEAEEKVQQFTAQMNKVMEKFIRLHPEQWFWIHRRWKTRPPSRVATDEVGGFPEQIEDLYATRVN